MGLSAIHMPSLAFAAATLGASTMNAVFSFYYVKVYLNLFNVSESWFQFAQIVFLIWNAINDPLFGYIQDNFSFSWVRTRRHSILYGAPLFAISFIVLWIPWGDYSKSTWLCGFQLMISLCFYDSLFTFVVLAQCALFTEMSPLHEDRIRLVRYSQMASLIGSSSVFFTGLVSENLNNYPVFVISCLVIAVIALICMVYTGRNAYTQYDKKENKSNGDHSEQEIVKKTSGNRGASHNQKQTKKGEQVSNIPEDPVVESIWRQMWQIFSQRSFVSFVLVNLCQIYHFVFYSNFASIFCDKLISDEVMSSSTRSAFYGSLFILPQILVISGASVIGKVGYYKVIRSSFILKICMGVLLYLIGPHWWALVIFFIVECGEAQATFSIFNLCLSDIIDEDKAKFQRKHPLSSMVFGTNALITKPSHSFAPMLTVAILNGYGYESLKATTDVSLLVSPAYASLQHAMFVTTCATPVVIGILQLFMWSFYTIRNSHLVVSKYVES